MRAIYLICETSFHQFSFEGDLEIVMNSLRHGDIFHSSVGHLIKDTLSYASSL